MELNHPRQTFNHPPRLKITFFSLNKKNPNSVSSKYWTSNTSYTSNAILNLETSEVVLWAICWLIFYLLIKLLPFYYIVENSWAKFKIKLSSNLKTKCHAFGNLRNFLIFSYIILVSQFSTYTRSYLHTFFRSIFF